MLRVQCDARSSPHRSAPVPTEAAEYCTVLARGVTAHARPASMAKSNMAGGIIIAVAINICPQFPRV